MNANNIEATTLFVKSRLGGCSFNEEPGAKTMIFSQNKIPIQLVNIRSTDFKERFFPLTTTTSWNDWKWQLRNSFTSIEDLRKIMKLSNKEIIDRKSVV